MMSAPASPYAKRIVRHLIRDIESRKGLRHEWNQIDGATRAEIETEWCAIIDEQLKGTLL